MSKPSLLFSNARVKCFENNLLTNEKIMRMVFAETLTDAVRILMENGYGSGVNAQNYDIILNEEESRLSDFVAESMPQNSGMESFLAKNDYHNAKSYVKAKLLGEEDASYMLNPNGLIGKELLKESITNRDYSSLPTQMATALNQIDELVQTKQASPRNIDIVLDKAMYKDISNIVNKSKSKSIKKYWIASIDFINIISMLRCRNIGQDYEFFVGNFVDGGDLKLDLFQQNFNQSLELFAEKIKNTSYGKVAYDNIVANDLTALERSWDNYLLDIFRNDRNDVFSIAPLAGYYIAKKIEIKQVRMICILIKNNIDKSKIKERLRELYA